jgi:O-antigen/teichoic acid export membrane protein
MRPVVEREQNVKTVARGAGVLLPATLVGTLLILGNEMLINGSLTTAEYGVYTTCKRVLQIGFLVAYLGMENAVIRFVSQGQADDDPAASAGAWRTAQAWSLGAGLLMGVFLWVFADPIGRFFDPDPTPYLPAALRVLAIALPLAAVRMLSASASQGLMVMWPKALILQIAWPLGVIVGVFALTVMGGQGLTGVLWAYDASMAVGAVLAVATLIYIRPSMVDLRVAGTGSTRALLTFAAPLLAYTMVHALYVWLDQLMLARLDGMEAAGIYGPVAILAPLFAVGVTALNGIFAPMIAQLHHQGKRDELGSLYRTVARWALVLAVPLCVGALVVPEHVIGIFPNGRVEAVPALQVLAIAYVPVVTAGGVNYMLMMSGHQRYVLYNGIPAVAVNLGLSAWLIPGWGPTGAAVANGAALLFNGALALIQIRWHLSIHPFSRSMGKPLVAALPAALAGLGVASVVSDLPSIVVVALVGLGIAPVYGAALVVLGLDEDDRVVITAIKNKLPARFRR